MLFAEVDPVVPLFASIAVLLVLVKLGVHLSVSVLAGTLTLLILSRSYENVVSLTYYTLLDPQTWELVWIVICAVGLSAAMDASGMLRRLTRSLRSVGPRAALYLIPFVVGFVPMPAGALVSATMVKRLAEEHELPPEKIAFLNYWFRHIVEFSWPTYQSVVLTGTVLSMSVSEVVRALLPMTAIGGLVGLAVSWLTPGGGRGCTHKGLKVGNVGSEFVKSSWPILLVVMLVIVLGVEAALAFPTSVAAVLLVGRLGRSSLRRVFVEAFNPRIASLLIAVMLYKNAVECTGLAHALHTSLSQHGTPGLPVLSLLPFIVGAATGMSIAFVSVTFPLLAPILSANGISYGGLVLSYVSGMLGMLLSPLHLCLPLSVEYFKASITSVYRYLLPATALTYLIAVGLYVALS